MKMNKRLLIGILLIGVWETGIGRLSAQTSGSQASSAGAQDNIQISDQEIELLRKDLRSQKKQLVAANLKLTEDQATKFWPVYDQYIAEQTKIHDQKYAVIKEFATNFLKVLPGKQVATFFQIDRRLQMMVDLQLMSQLPLIQSQ